MRKLDGDGPIDFVDMFCGAGGSSVGLTQAGWKLRLGANHWARAIATHSANFPDADHACEDINAMDMRRLPRARCLWASPICTEASPAGGTKSETDQLNLLHQLREEGATDRINAMTRTRATFMDVIRATELWRYDAVLIENVPDVAKKWRLFDWWIGGMKLLGYNVQFVSVSSAHVGGPGNPHAPQWRDRLYLVFTREGIPLPDVDPRPVAWCQKCGEDVAARQAWKKPGARRIGKYGRNGQYIYVCPNVACRHSTVEPYVLPALAAIDWSDLGQRIGDRKKPLAAATMRRIQVGVDLWCQPVTLAAGGNTYERPGYTRVWPAMDSPLTARTGTPGDGVATPPFMVSANHDGDGRTYPADARPLATRTTKIGEGIVTPFLAVLRGGGSKEATIPVTSPLGTITGQGVHHGLTVPPGAFIQKHHGGLDYARPEHMTNTVHAPLGTVVGKPNMSLVIPYRRGEKPHRADGQPLSTVTTHQTHGYVGQAAVDVNDCHFRMLTWREHADAQRIYFTGPGDYEFTGTGTEKTLQAGNAVSSNVAQWLGQAVAAALGAGS